MAEVSTAELLQLQQGMSEQQKLMFMSQYNSDKKDRSTTLVLSVVLGTLGVDRFYLGDTGLGALKLLTLGGCGIWWLIDLFNITGKADEYNRQKAREIAMAIKAAS